MSDTPTPVTVSEPPMPAETVSPNDRWTIRVIVIIIGVVLAMIVGGSILLAYQGKTMDTEIKTLGALLAGGLVGAITLRSSGPTTSPRRDRGSIDLRDLVLVLGAIALVLLIIYYWHRV